MGFGDSMKKLIGIEDIDVEDEEITDAEIKEAKEKMAEEAMSRQSSMKRSAANDTITDRRAPIHESARKSAPRQPMSSNASGRQTSLNERRISMSSGTSAFKLVLIEPKTFEECPRLVDSLKGRRPIIINLEKLETEVAKKIFDFLSGAAYALNGSVQKVANNIFIFAPENVDIAGGRQADQTGFEYGDGVSAEPQSPWR